MTLRIYADFNSGGAPGHGSCWLLRYGPDRRLLDEVAKELNLQPGMTVTLYYEEEYEGEREAIEVSAVLEEHADSTVRWWALPNWSSRRDLDY